MNRLVKAIVFSVSSALIATSAFAVPQYHQPPQGPKPQVQDNKIHYQSQQQVHLKPSTLQAYDKSVKPSHDWHVGQKLPVKYQNNAYHVNYKQSHKISKPAPNQQWIKVNNDYVLTKTNNHTIVKIISG